MSDDQAADKAPKKTGIELETTGLSAKVLDKVPKKTGIELETTGLSAKVLEELQERLVKKILSCVP